ncbi:unnamed protein product, partial [Amoebophrya sp. A25]
LEADKAESTATQASPRATTPLSPLLREPAGVAVEMLDLAHSVFNAVTGVSEEDEVREIRAFRPIQEWREICTNVGFRDAMLFEIEPEDCTWDEMLLFCKPEEDADVEGEGKQENIEAVQRDRLEEGERIVLKEQSPPTEAGKDADSDLQTVAKEQLPPPPVIDIIKTILGQIPASAANSLASLLTTVGDDVLPAIAQKLQSLIEKDVLVPKAIFAEKLFPAVGQFLDTCKRAIQKIRDMLEKVKVRDIMQIPDDVVPGELFLIVPYLQWREMEQSQAKEREPIAKSTSPSTSASSESPKLDDMERMALQFCRDYLPFLLLPEKDISSGVRRFSRGGEPGKHLPGSSLSSSGSEVNANENSSAIYQTSREGHDMENHQKSYASAPSASATVVWQDALSRPSNRELIAQPVVTTGMVYRELLLLDADLPGLCKPETLAKTGFTVRQQTALIAKFGGGKNLRDAAENLAWFLTPEIWRDVLEAVDEVVRHAHSSPTTTSAPSYSPLPSPRTLLE